MAQDDAAKQLLDLLTSTRAGYGEETVWHKFLLDAYTGCGGFAGRVKPPEQDYLGWAAGVYSAGALSNVLPGPRSKLETYLDRFPREDEPKFERRRDVAHYVNYVGPIADLLASYLCSQPPTREGIDEQSEIAAWMQDADGRGTSWDELKVGTIVPRAVSLGWCPVLFDTDAPPEDVEVTTRAQEQALELKTRAIPLFPAQILKWQTDDSGALLWVKIRLDYSEQLDPLGAEAAFTKIQLWTREDVRVYRIDEGEGGKKTARLISEREHNFGAVPMVVFRAMPAPDDPVRGISAVGSVAVENRRHFNLLSELDEHLRSTVFALLQVPIPDGAEKPEELLAGSGNAVPVPASAQQGYRFVSPDQSVADTYENRLKASEREIHRVASVPFDNDSGAAQSGISRAYQFEGTNKRLVKIAGGMASAEQRGLQMAARQSGASEDRVKAIRNTPPADFRIDDLAVDIENLIKTLNIRGMSATAKMLLVLRNLIKMLPNLTAEDRKKIEAELEAQRDRELEAAEKAPAAPAGGDPNADPDDADPGEDEDAGEGEPGSDGDQQQAAA